MRKRLKVAFCMAGGASLGAFAAGATAEIVAQLHRNRSRRWSSVEIDVLTGASAGGMTAAILVRSLADPANHSPADAIRRLHGNMFHAWVEKVDIEDLIPHPKMRDVSSLLNRGAVDAIARSIFRWPRAAAPRPQLLGSRVFLGVTLLNYNGIPISAAREEDLRDWLTTTAFEDARVFCLDFETTDLPRAERWMSFGPGALRHGAAWSTIAATTIAGGAFPGAFEPVVLRRLREEFGPFWEEMFDPKVESFPFTHGDGGAFQNEPLREAMQLIRYQDSGDDPATFDRVLFAIDPHVTGGAHDPTLRFHVGHRINPDYGIFDGEDVVAAGFAARLRETVERLVVAIRGQAAFKDYLAADKINNRLQWRTATRALLGDLVEAVEPGHLDGLAATAETLLEEMIEHKRQVSLVPADSLRAARELARVRREMETEGTAPASPAGARLACALFALLDQVGNLRRKSEVGVFAVAPTWFTPPGRGAAPVRVELAGDFLSSFGGFFDSTYRTQDFDAGRAVAGSVLAHPPAIGSEREMALLADPDDRPALPEMRDPDVTSKPVARQRFADRLGYVAAALVKDSFSNQLVRFAGAAVASAFVPRLVKKPEERRDLAILRLLVEPRNAGDRFFLAGKAGDAGERRDATSRDEPVELITVVRFSRPGEQAVLEGPHVYARGHQNYVEVRENRRGFGDRGREIALPPVSMLREHRNLGLPIFTTRVKRDPPVGAETEWDVDEGLTPLDETL